jgi:hypothetical protein
MRSPRLLKPIEHTGCKLTASTLPLDLEVTPGFLAGLPTRMARDRPTTAESIPLTWDVTNTLFYGEPGDYSPWFRTIWLGYVFEIRPITGVQIPETEFAITCCSRDTTYTSQILAHTHTFKIDSAVDLVRVVALVVALRGTTAFVPAHRTQSAAGSYPFPASGLVVTGLNNVDHLPSFSLMTPNNPSSRSLFDRWFNMGGGK